MPGNQHVWGTYTSRIHPVLVAQSGARPSPKAGEHDHGVEVSIRERQPHSITYHVRPWPWIDIRPDGRALSRSISSVWGAGSGSTSVWPASLPAPVGGAGGGVAVWAAILLVVHSLGGFLQPAYAGAGASATLRTAGDGSGRTNRATDLSVASLFPTAVSTRGVLMGELGLEGR